MNNLHFLIFMSKTTQFKFLIKNKEEFERNIRSKKIEFGEESVHSYTYFKIPKAFDLDAILRIKESKEKISTDLKIKENRSGEYDHFESAIGDMDQMTQIYSRLGYEPIVTFHKTRKTFQNEFVRLDLDLVKELGTFLEVKFSMDKIEKVKKFLKNLGVDINKADKRSNIDIYTSLLK